MFALLLGVPYCVQASQPSHLLLEGADFPAPLAVSSSALFTYLCGSEEQPFTSMEEIKVCIRGCC